MQTEKKRVIEEVEKERSQWPITMYALVICRFGFKIEDPKSDE